MSMQIGAHEPLTERRRTRNLNLRRRPGVQDCPSKIPKRDKRLDGKEIPTLC